MSLTTVSEPIARTLAEHQRQRGHSVTIRRLDDDADGAQAPEPEPAPAPERAPAPEPARAPAPTRALEPTQKVEPTPTLQPTQKVEPTPTPEPAQAVELAPVLKAAHEPEPARAARPARGRRLLLYGFAAGCIVVAAAMADHWDVLPRMGATTSSSPAQVGGPPHHSQLIPPRISRRSCTSATPSAASAGRLRLHGEQPGAAGLYAPGHPVVRGG